MFVAILAAAMSAEKQLQAAQRFLRGIVSLSSYGEVRDKQALGVEKALDKAVSFTAAQAASLLSALEPDLWGETVANRLRGIVAQKALPVEVENLRAGPTQDFGLLPYYLPDDLAQDLGKDEVDSERLLCRLCQHASKLSLRNASEATKATLVVLAKWSLCKRGLSPKQQHDLFCRFKPIVTRYLIAAPENVKPLLALPLAFEELDPELVSRAFPTGKPTQIPDLAQEICNYVRRIPLRKDNRLLQGSTHVVPMNGPVPGGYVAVEDICKVVEACNKSQPSALERAHSGQASNLPAGTSTQPLLAICDVSAADSVSPLPTGEEPKTGAKSMSVDEQLAALKGDIDAVTEPRATGCMKRPATCRWPRSRYCEASNFQEASCFDGRRCV